MGKRLIVSTINLAIVMAVSLGLGTTGANAKIPDVQYRSADNADNQAVYAQSNAALQASQAGPSVPGTDWPMLGHNQQRTSYSAAETFISARNVTSLRPMWQQYIYRVGGTPASNPVTYEGKVYLGSSSYDSQDPNFFAFDAITGTRLWETNLGNYQDNCFGVGIGSTAAVGNNTVSVGGGDTAYYGLDALTGRQRWRHDITGRIPGNYYPWVSPLIHTPSSGDSPRTYIGVASACDNPQVPGAVRALDLMSGQQLANRPLVPDGCTGATLWHPPALSPDGTKLVITTGEDQPCGIPEIYSRSIIVLDPISLRILAWHQVGDPYPQDEDWGTGPVIFPAGSATDTLYVGALHKTYPPPEPTNDGWFNAYRLDDVSSGPVWSTRVGHHVGAGAAYDPTIEGGTLFVPVNEYHHPDSDVVDARVYALNPASGAIRRILTLPANSVWGQIVVANGLLYINVHGSVRIYDASNFQLRHTLTPPNPEGNFTGVTVSGGKVLWVSGDYLNAWGLSATPNP